MNVKSAARSAQGPAATRSPEGGLADTEAVVDLEVLFRLYGASCYRLARSILRDADFAQDAVQEAFLEHWRSGTFDATRSTQRAWLLMLTHRKAVDRIRREQRRRHMPMTAATEQLSTWRGPEELALAHVVGPKVRAALTTLSRVQQEALTLAYWGGYTQPEIAQITQTPVGTVKTRMRAGMIALRESLVDERNVA